MKRPLIGICIPYASLMKLATVRVMKFTDKHPDTQVDFICFHIKDLNLDTLQVTAVKFQKGTGEWEKGVFPVPDVIFLQGILPSPVIKKIESVIGPNVFNNFLFDKWEGWEFLSKHKNIRKHLPDTKKYNKDELLTYMSHYPDFFLKPVKGSSSIGIVRIKSLNKGAFEASYPVSKDMIKEEFQSRNELCRWIDSRVKDGNFILQEGIKTLKHKNRIVDIRLNMNKKGSGIWEVSLILFRISSTNDMLVPLTVSQACTFEQLQQFSIYPNVDLKKLKSSIISLGAKICFAFDQAGYHMADLGIDLGLDENGHLWVFEVNHIPYPALGAIQDPSVISPLEYAIYLANKNQQ